MIGDLPEDYQEVYDIMKAFFGATFGDGDAHPAAINSTNNNWNNYPDAVAAYETWAKAMVGLTQKQFSFSNYLSTSNNGMYFYNTGVSETTRTLGTMITYRFNMLQDEMTETGKSPTAPSYSTYIQRSYSGGSWTTTWKEGQNGATYLAANEAYFELVKTDRVEPSQQAFKDIVSYYETKYPGITDAADAVIEIGVPYILGETEADADSFQEMMDAINSLSEEGLSVFNSICSNSTLWIAATMVPAIEFNEETSAEDAYNNRISVTSYTPNSVISQVNAYLNTLLLAEFIDYVNGVDMDALTDEIISEVKSQYSTLDSTSKGSIPEDTYNKFVQIVTPIKDTNDFSAEIATFQPTSFVRPPESRVAWTEGGIQSFADSLEGLLSGFGLDIGALLSDNLYQDEIIEAIMDLYATLAHDQTEIDVGMGGLTFPLGTIIGWIVTPDSLAAQLEEDKFDGAVAKIEAIEVTEEDEAAGLDEYDKLASIDFTAEDFGFTAGDKDGFIDALLAALRPITVLLDPDAQISAILGVKVSVNIRMFNYEISDQGEYVSGVYERLLPILEQLGLNDLPTADEYKENYYDVKDASGANIAADEFLRPILDSLFTNIVDPLGTNPVNTLIDVLPRLAYVVDEDRLNDCIKSAFERLGVLNGLAGSLDLSTEAINNMIPDTIDIGSLVGGDTELVLNIGDIPWSTLADCATLSAVPSSTITNAYTLLRTGDTDSCLSTVLYWLYDVALADADTYAALKDLIVGLVPDNLTSLINTVIAQVLDPVQAAGKVDGYGLLLDNALLGAQPTGNEIWKIEAAAGQGGSISPSGTVELKQADSKTFTITANAGYTISSLTVNGQPVAAAAGQTSYEYTLSGADVTSSDSVNYYPTDATISVTFADESGEPAPGPDPSDPSNPTNPSDPGNQGGGNTNTGDNNNGTATLPSVNNNNPNLPNTGAAEIAGMSVLTVIIAIAVGAAVWFILKKRIVKD